MQTRNAGMQNARRRSVLSQSFHAIPPGAAGHNRPDARQRLRQEPDLNKSRVVLSAAALVSATLTIMTGAWASGSRVHAQTETDSIVGVWTLNKDLSQTPQRRAQDDDGAPRGGGYGRGGGGRGRRRGRGFRGGGDVGGGGGGGRGGRPRGGGGAAG